MLPNIFNQFGIYFLIFFRGENEPIRKGLDSVSITNLDTPPNSNIVFMGTLVRSGHGIGVVYAIGKETNLGSVMKLVSEVSQHLSTLIDLTNLP